MNLNMYCIWSHHKMLFLVCVSRILCSLQMELDRPGHGPKGDCLHTTRCHEGKHFWWRGDDCTFQTVTNWMQTIFQGCHEHNMFAFFFKKKQCFGVIWMTVLHIKYAMKHYFCLDLILKVVQHVQKRKMFRRTTFQTPKRMFGESTLIDIQSISHWNPFRFICNNTVHFWWQ